MSGPAYSKSSTDNKTQSTVNTSTNTVDSNNTSVNYSANVTTTNTGIQSGDLEALISNIENSATTAIDSVAASNVGSAGSTTQLPVESTSSSIFSNLSTGETLALAAAGVGLLIFLKGK